jgi:hypothetical protein
MMVKGIRATRGVAGRSRARGPVGTGIAVLATALALSACSAGDTGDTGTAGPPAGAAPANAPQDVVDKAAQRAVPKADPATGASSTELAAYFAAAERADANLRRAATLINGGMARDRLRIRPETVAAIEAAAPKALQATIPAGMPPELMRSVLLTYSELASRYYAMRHVLDAGDPRREVVVPRSQTVSPTLAEIVDGLRNGAASAARFDRDLAAAKSLARRHALTGAGPRSRAAAELSVRLQHIVISNGCCVSTGGEIFTRLAPLDWTGGQDRRSWTGHVGGVGFRADWTGRGWNVRLEAG